LLSRSRSIDSKFVQSSIQLDAVNKHERSQDDGDRCYQDSVDRIHYSATGPRGKWFIYSASTRRSVFLWKELEQKNQSNEKCNEGDVEEDCEVEVSPLQVVDSAHEEENEEAESHEIEEGWRFYQENLDECRSVAKDLSRQQEEEHAAS